MLLFFMLFKQLGVGQAARRDDDNIGVQRGDGFGFSPCVEVECHIPGGTLRHSPVDNSDHFAASRRLCCQSYLAAGVGGGFKNGDHVAAFSSNARGLEPCGTSTDDYDLLLGGRPIDVMRHRQFTTRGSVMYT